MQPEWVFQRPFLSWDFPEVRDADPVVMPLNPGAVGEQELLLIDDVLHCLQVRISLGLPQN